MTDKIKDKPLSKTEEKAKRMQDALRENLLKRKQQQRMRSTQKDDESNKK